MDPEERAVFALPAVKAAPFLAAGMLCAYFFGIIGSAVFAAAAAVFLFFAIKKNRKLVLCAAGALAGVLIMTLHLRLYCESVLAYAGQTVRAEIVVDEMINSSSDTQKFIGKINLGGRTANVRFTGKARVEEGWKAVADVELEAPDPEYFTQNLAKGILLSGNITEFYEITPSPADVVSIIKAARHGLSRGLCENLFGESESLAEAFIFGNDDELSYELYEKIRISGAAHYTSVSGTHFAILAAVLLMQIPESKRRAKVVLSLLAAPAAVLFFGASASVIRASIMFFISALSRLFLRRPHTLNSLCLTMIIVFTLSPGAILDAGFLMSVLGVFGAGVISPKVSEKILEYTPKLPKILKKAIRTLSMSLCALICTSPVSAAFFGGVSVFAVFTSILLAPLLAAAMVFMIISAVLGSVWAVPIDIAMRLAALVIRIFGGAREAFLPLDFTGAWVLPCVSVIFLSMTAFGTMKTARKSSAGLLISAILQIIIILIVRETRSEIRFVGSSRTNAAIVIRRDTAAVYIAGNGTGLADDISRCLREHGAVKVSALAAFDADLCGAETVRELSSLVDIDEIYTSKEAKAVLAGLPVKEAKTGAAFVVNGLEIASASSGKEPPNADITLFYGTYRNYPEPANIGVFFAPSHARLPENSLNPRADRFASIKLAPTEPEVVVRGIE